MRVALTLLALALAAHLPQLVRVDWSGTEAFRTLIAHEMVESGNWLVPRLGGELKATKPPLFYWLLAVADLGFGLRPWAMRLPALVLVWLCAVAVHRTVQRRFDGTTAWLAAVGVVTSPVILWHGAFAEIDPVFAALTAVSIVWLGEAAGGGGRGRFVAAGLVGSLALLAKGPPYLMFLLGALWPWYRDARLRGMLWFLPALIAPFAAYYVVLTTAAVGLSAAELSAVAQEESVGRIGYFDERSLLDMPVHPLRAALLTLPFGLFVRRGSVAAGPQTTLRDACAWAYLSCVVVLLVFPARPVRYLLPGIVLGVVALAPMVRAFLVDPQPVGTAARRVVVGIGVLGALGVVVLPWLPFPMPGWSWVGALLVAGGAALVRTRAHVVAFAIALPVVFVWTVGVDRERYMSSGLRSDHAVVAALRTQIDEFGIEELEVWVFVRESIALELDPTMRWNLGGDDVPGSRWVLAQANDHSGPLALPAGFVERARVRGHRRSYVLAEKPR